MTAAGISGKSRISRVWGRHSPTRFPQGQNEQTANAAAFFVNFPSFSTTPQKEILPNPVANFLLFLIQVISKNAKMGTKKAANPLNRFTAFGCRQSGGYSVVDCGAWKYLSAVLKG